MFHLIVGKSPVLLVIFALTLLSSGTALAGRVVGPMPLWPKGPPNDPGVSGAEQDTTKPTDHKVAGKWVIRLGNVSTPTITVYRPSRFKANGAAVVVCPGGGYHILAMDLEGTEVCQWLNSIGVTAVLLKYRVPARTNDDGHILPLQDAQRALGLVRFNAKAWGIDPARIGILGFSAGGHLSAHLCSRNEHRDYEAVDDADQVSCRPDFALLIYPAYLTPKGGTALAPDIHVTQDTPQTFMAQAENDTTFIDSLLVYYRALKDAKVPAEMHIYPTGGHGFGLRPTDDVVTTWPKRAEEWLRARGLLRKPGH